MVSVPYIVGGVFIRPLPMPLKKNGGLAAPRQKQYSEILRRPIQLSDQGQIPFIDVAMAYRSAEINSSHTPAPTNGSATPSRGRITRIAPTIKRIRPIHHVIFFGAESFIRHLLKGILFIITHAPHGAYRTMVKIKKIRGIIEVPLVGTAVHFCHAHLDRYYTIYY
jgi:hypothetical protein